MGLAKTVWDVLNMPMRDVIDEIMGKPLEPTDIEQLRNDVFHQMYGNRYLTPYDFERRLNEALESANVFR